MATMTPLWRWSSAGIAEAATVRPRAASDPEPPAGMPKGQAAAEGGRLRDRDAQCKRAGARLMLAGREGYMSGGRQPDSPAAGCRGWDGMAAVTSQGCAPFRACLLPATTACLYLAVPQRLLVSPAVGLPGIDVACSHAGSSGVRVTAKPCASVQTRARTPVSGDAVGKLRSCLALRCMPASSQPASQPASLGGRLLLLLLLPLPAFALQGRASAAPARIIGRERNGMPNFTWLAAGAGSAAMIGRASSCVKAIIT